MANLCFGIYTNLSIWYKLTDRTLLGAAVSMVGALITIVLNIVFIRDYGYMASAWATLACYAFMAITSYLLGQKYYPVQYDLKKILGYIFSGLALWLVFKWISESVWPAPNYLWLLSTLFMGVFLAFVWVLDGKQLLKPQPTNGKGI
jgi:O-antigen/teichoic acid export membrane protein